MEKWLFELELRGEQGTSVDLKIPTFSEGDKFDRWACGELKITADGLSFISAIDLEYSDICGLSDALSKVEAGQHLLWQAMEERFALDITASSLGTATVLVELKNQSGSVRLLRIAVDVPVPVIQELSKMLNHQLEAD
jgi:hypothetical protein